MNQPANETKTNMKNETLSETETTYLAKRLGKKLDWSCPMFRNLHNRGFVTVETRSSGAYMKAVTAQTIVDARDR